ncbi:hypothetical protein DOL92_04560 [Acinetobacter nosocomialis]|uniref:DUF723 domain-containing protein n=1 Tax=Acinetobacter nosocomialis TaxID=106654 RepID=UPI000DA8FFDE|nr:DUF723 domain-containing protein [Acinetobacter nosocomialis]PZM04657.1 hypothetical protein DOL92_04560 [Acinetobacter nosocomialis]
MRKSTLTKEDFIQQAKLIHSDKYNYDEVEFSYKKDIISIECKEHGFFHQMVGSHLRGFGCLKCRKTRPSIGIDEFIERANKVHNSKYSYVGSIFNGVDKQIAIICPKHGEFYQMAGNHMKGHGCPACAGCKRLDNITIIQQFKEVHGDTYNYSRVEYIGIDKPVEIICPSHGVFSQTPYQHRLGSGCVKCSTLKTTIKSIKTFSDFVNHAQKVHGNIYKYDESSYVSSNKKVKIFCEDHGWFHQKAAGHTNGLKCPKCADLCRNAYARQKYIRACKDTDGLSNLYIIKMHSESEVFFKVGITKHNPKVRFRKVKCYSIKHEIMYRGEAGFIYDLEHKLHKLLRDFKYRPLKSFEGQSECFSEIPKQITDFVEGLFRTNQLQLIV